MLILFTLFIFVGLGICWYAKEHARSCNEDMLEYFGVTLITIGALAFLFSSCFIAQKVISNITISDKIEMLETENADIEVGIKQIVGSYMNYEQLTYENLNQADVTTLVALYPELKASDLVNAQLTMYYENKTQVKKLKLERIDNSNWRFIAYFGGTR